jgi:hypothetical protein
LLSWGAAIALLHKSMKTKSKRVTTIALKFLCREKKFRLRKVEKS